MSFYYKYDFVSPEPIFARVKEELRSYFNTGLLDDLLFESWLNDCIGHLSNSAYKIEETVLELENFEAILPDNFQAVREAWLCTKEFTEYRTPSSYYYQTDCRITRIDDACHPCFTPNDPPCSIPNKYRVTHKVQGHTIFEFNKHYLLKPGNISRRGNCDLFCKNYGASAPDSFDIAGNKFMANFSSGTVYLVYYTENFDDSGYSLIPDNFRIRDYVEKYIKYKCYCDLYNQVTDETFNQIRIKKMDANAEVDEALIEAKIELKKETLQQKVMAMKKSNRRNRRFNIR